MNPLRRTAVLVATVLVGACTSAGTSASPSPTQTGSQPRPVTAQATAASVPACVTQTYNAMTANQRIGTLFMVGVPVADLPEVSTGTPRDMASSTGMPKPSSSEGKAKILARA